MSFNKHTIRWFVGKMAMKGWEDYITNTSVDRGIKEYHFIMEVLEEIKRIEQSSIKQAGSQEIIDQEMSDINNAR